MITASWRSEHGDSALAFESYAVIVITEKNAVRAEVEGQMVNALKHIGKQAIRSIDILPPTIEEKRLDKRRMLDSLKSADVDAVITISLLDVESETRFEPGRYTYVPSIRFGWYGSFWGYYSHWYPMVQKPGYFTEDKVYYLELNMYELRTESLIWSAQSETWSPSNLKTASKDFSQQVIKRMKKDKAIRASNSY